MCCVRFTILWLPCGLLALLASLFAAVRFHPKVITREGFIGHCRHEYLTHGPVLFPLPPLCVCVSLFALTKGRKTEPFRTDRCCVPMNQWAERVRGLLARSSREGLCDLLFKFEHKVPLECDWLSIINEGKAVSVRTPRTDLPFPSPRSASDDLRVAQHGCQNIPIKTKQ